ncbi:MAG: LCP family protein [Bacilli bacterium]
MRLFTRNYKTLKRYINNMPNKPCFYILTFLFASLVIITGYFIFLLVKLAGIETFWRYLIITLSILGLIVFFFFYKKVVTGNKKSKMVIFIITLLLIIPVEGFIIFNINKMFSSLARINREMVTYSTSLVTLVNSDLNTINDVSGLKLGIIKDKDSIEGYIISQEIIKANKLKDNNEIIEYDNFILMVSSLYAKEVDAIFLPTNYAFMFASIDEFNNIKHETKVIIKKDKKMPRDIITTDSSDKKLTEPFTLLLLGVDSEHEGLNKNAAFNGDALMLITFNPNTLSATMLSIPRDSYVPIMCFKDQIENKITHAAWYGESCMIKTIENFTGIDIDYYIKMNFKGVVALVDALDGIYVDVPITFCSQNSDRKTGKHSVCLQKGYRKLNGEQALALSRNRNVLGDDITRGLYQQLVVAGMLNKAKDIRNLNQIYSILDTISNNLDTNINTKQILSFYEVGKDIIAKDKSYYNDDLVYIEKLYLDGYNKYIWDEGMRLALSNYVYNRASLKDVVRAMEINLDLEKPNIIKTFSFSINEPYKVTIIGKGPYRTDYVIKTVPNFTQQSKEWALNWGVQNNIKISFTTIDNTHQEYKDTYVNGQIIGQSIPEHFRLDKMNKAKGITLKVIKKEENILDGEIINCNLEENSHLSNCLVPNMQGWTLNQFDNWYHSIKINIIVEKKPIDIDSVTPLYDPSKAGTINSQSKDAGTKLIDIAEIIVYYFVKPADVKDEAPAD